jgi:hypothetical protein
MEKEDVRVGLLKKKFVTAHPENRRFLPYSNR